MGENFNKFKNYSPYEFFSCKNIVGNISGSLYYEGLGKKTFD
jgi:hypothetical protein